MLQLLLWLILLSRIPDRMQAIPFIPTHFSVLWPVSLSSVCHIYALCLNCSAFSRFACHLVGALCGVQWRIMSDRGLWIPAKGSFGVKPPIKPWCNSELWPNCQSYGEYKWEFGWTLTCSVFFTFLFLCCLSRVSYNKKTGGKNQYADLFYEQMTFTIMM